MEDILSKVVRLGRYSRRKSDGSRETWEEVIDRVVTGISQLGKFTKQEAALIRWGLETKKALPAGRALWVAGTPWSLNPRNYFGLYNCVSIDFDSLECFPLMLDLAMMGCGTGAVLLKDDIDRLPKPKKRIEIRSVRADFGSKPSIEKTSVKGSGASNLFRLTVGDSREGWVQAYRYIIEAACNQSPFWHSTLVFDIDLSHVRPAGSLLKGFGGISNPCGLPRLFHEMQRIINQAVDAGGWTPLLVCLLIDVAALVVVLGNIRRSAGMRQFSPHDEEARQSKKGLWVPGPDGQWQIDPERDALRMANHTVVFTEKPSYEEVRDAVLSQYRTGEGAIQWAREAIVRCSPEFPAEEVREACEKGKLVDYFQGKGLHPLEAKHRARRFGLNPCGEIIGRNFVCNLADVHLTQFVNPLDYEEQSRAFRACALCVAAHLHHQSFTGRLGSSRMMDPIVGVSFTGLFDYFINVLGEHWLRWVIEEKRSDDSEVGRQFRAYEIETLTRWRLIVEDTVYDYCDRHNLKRPNRCTTVQPSGTKSLLTGSSPGWHPDKGGCYIRRVTVPANDPLALAAMDVGYSVVPSANSRHSDGTLVETIHHPDAIEWLIEIPVKKPWVDKLSEPGKRLDISKVPIESQYDLWMTVQRHYTRHNTSATLEVTEDEVPILAQLIHQSIENDEGYISAAVLARFDGAGTFPRLPFEPISEKQYQAATAAIRKRRRYSDFDKRLRLHDLRNPVRIEGPTGCDSDHCSIT